MSSLESLNFELLELLGIGYVIDHYISYFHKEQRKKVYQIYITDALKLIAENTAKAYNGSYLTMRYINVIEPPKEDKRSANEIVENIKEKLKRL